MPKKLESLLRHKDAEVRIQAIKELKKLEHDISIVIHLLIKSLEDNDWRVSKTAIEMLLEIKGEQVIKALINTLCLKDSVNARNSAFEALVSLGSEATSYLIEAYKSSSPDVKKFIIDILGKTRDLKALPLLLKALEDEDENVRASAVEQLGNIRKNVSVINALTGILINEDIWLAYPAADALGRIGDAKAVDALVSVLHRKALREPAIRALGQISDVHSLTSIAPFLKDESKTIRGEAAKAIAQFFKNGISEGIIVKGIKSALGNRGPNILLPLIQSNKKEVRVAAILLLGLLKDKNAIVPLLEMSIEEDLYEFVIRVLVFISRSMPRSLIPFFSVSESHKRRVICKVAGRVRDVAFLKPLIACLKDEDGHVRGEAAIALSHLNNPKAVTHIKPLLLDEYENVQEEAIKALSKLKKWLDLNEIIKGLSDKNSVLRKNSALLLGSLKEKNSVKALGVALKDSYIETRKAVIEALGAIGGTGSVKYLIQALTDESSEVRLIAAIAIGRIRSQECIEPLIILLGDTDARVRAAAVKGLGNVGNKEVVEPLIELLSDDSGFVKTAVIGALSNFKDERVKNALLQFLDNRDPEIRSAAVESLATFDGIVLDIIPLLEDEEWSVRKKAVDVLGKFFKDESYPYLKKVADTDKDLQVRKTAAGYLCV